MANKSLIDNPLADMDLGNLNGFTMSDLSQFNQVTNNVSDEVKQVSSEKELNDSMQKDINAMIKEQLNKSVSDEEKEIIKKLVDTQKNEHDKKVKDDSVINEEQLKEQHEQLLKRMDHETTQPKQDKKPKTTYTKKTYIINDEYIELIEGLHIIKDVEVKDVVNQLLEKALNTLDDTIKAKALKEGRKSLDSKKKNNNKSIF